MYYILKFYVRRLNLQLARKSILNAQSFTAFIRFMLINFLITPLSTGLRTLVVTALFQRCLAFIMPVFFFKFHIWKKVKSCLFAYFSPDSIVFLSMSYVK